MKSSNSPLSLTEIKSEELRLWQPLKGYRFSIDALLLADFVQMRKKDAKILELGAGCGVISLILAKRYQDITILAIEIQEILCDCAQKNIDINEMSGRIELICGDFNRLEEYIRPESFDYVISNPPYREPTTGRLCLDSCEALARHEILMDFNGLCRSAFYALKTGGRFWFIYPAELAVKAIALCRKHRLEPKRIRFVHARSGSPARLLLLEACKGCSEELLVEPPLFLENDQESSRL